MMRRRLVLALLAIAWALPAGAVVISDVRHDRQHLDPGKGESVRIEFRISAEAATRLEVYDGRDACIREVDLGTLAAGPHVALWDGRDALGRVVPPEAYTYTIAAVDVEDPVRWDLAYTTGGERLPVAGAAWDAEAGVIRYRIDEPGRVRIRIGLQNDGPLLRTLIDWVPRSAGTHEEAWDGKDSAGVFDLTNHARLEIVPEAFELPRNAILVGPPPARVELIEDLPSARMRADPREEREHRMFDFSRQPIERRRDFEVALVPVGDVRRTSDGAPIADGSLALQLRAADGEAAAILSERCEAVFFVDGQFIFEREIGFLPMTWTWTPTVAGAGTHYITANVRGYEGHFGLTTLRVVTVDEDRE